MTAYTDRTNSFERFLRRIGAPEELIGAFLLLTIYGENSDPAGCEDHGLILLDICRRYNFTVPFSQDGRLRWFKACHLPRELDGYASDTGQQGADAFDPIVEQAYRRGFDQGFQEAIDLTSKGGSTAALQTRGDTIHRWRMSPVIMGSTRPGTEEPWSPPVPKRERISTKLRYDVFEADNFRCRVCGISSNQGITLHVDHVVAVANGGSSDRENLQTLCDLCNLGKGAR